jgi:hypothetical protein
MVLSVLKMRLIVEKNRDLFSLDWGRVMQANGMPCGKLSLLIFQEVQSPGTILTFIKLSLTPS